MDDIPWNEPTMYPFNVFPPSTGQMYSGPPMPLDSIRRHALPVNEWPSAARGGEEENPLWYGVSSCKNTSKHIVVKHLSSKEANFLSIALSQKIEARLTQKLTTEEYNELKDIIVSAHNRASKRKLHPMLVSAWMSSLSNTRLVPEVPDAWVKLEKFIDFLLATTLKEQLTSGEKEKLVRTLKDTMTHHSWLKDKITDILDRLEGQ